jgi:prepilin-type N-terminal cleavage/methylation domain-containing protein
MNMKAGNRITGRTCSRFRRLWRGVSRLRSSAGFTLTELIVVVFMVGLVAVTAGMKYGSFGSSANLRTAIDQVAGDLRFLQCRTMAVYSTTPPPTLRSVTFPAGGTTYNLGGQVKSLPTGVTMSISPGLTVTFNSLGECTTGAILTLNSRGSTGSVKIYAISGDVEAY